MDHVALGPARQVVADTSKPKRLNPFERYLSLWVALCMVAGVLLGLAVPGLTEGLRRLEFGAGHDLSLPSSVALRNRSPHEGERSLLLFLVNEISRIERPVSVARAASPRRSTGQGWERSAA
jgi:hypothetical protein